MSGHIPPVRERAGAVLRSVAERLSPRQRQYGLLGLILVGGVGLLWLILALTAAPIHPTDVARRLDQPGSVTNIGVSAIGSLKAVADGPTRSNPAASSLPAMS